MHALKIYFIYVDKACDFTKGSAVTLFKIFVTTIMFWFLYYQTICFCAKARFVDKAKKELEEDGNETKAKMTENQAVIDLSVKLKDLITDSVNIFIQNGFKAK